MNLQKPDIITTIESEGFAPKQRRKSFWLSCPFHSEKTPSLKIDTDKQRFYCFGCGISGDSISFIQKLHRLNFKEAIQYLNIQKPLRINPETQKKRALVNAFREWEKSLRKELTDYFREFKANTRNLRTWEEVEEFEDDFHLMPIVEWHLDILANGTDEEKFNLFKRMNENGRI